jgi:plasmid stabilization system protein ParE
MSLPVIILPRAKEDLRQTLFWWAENRSAEQAERWYTGILAAIETLTENPHRCPVAREAAAFSYELRELHYGLGSHPTHRALFTIGPDAVLVLTIRHVAQQDVSPDEI